MCPRAEALVRCPTVPEPSIEVPDAVRGGAGLSPGMRATAVALSEALFATRRGPPPADQLAWLADDLDDFLRRAGSHARWSMRLCLLAVAWMVPLFMRRLGGFAAMDLASRTEGLERMEASSLGVPFFGAKAILCVLWYEHEENARHAGYDGESLVSVRRSRTSGIVDAGAQR